MPHRQGDSGPADDRSDSVQAWMPLGRRSFAGIGLCVVLVTLAGCLGGGLVDPTATDPSDRTATETPVCVDPYDADVDDAPLSCLTKELPPDLTYENEHNETHNLSVRITRTNDSTVVFASNVTVQPGSSSTWEDVIAAPGAYRIKATKGGNNSVSDRKLVRFDKRYRGEGGVKWSITVHSESRIEIQPE